MTKEIKIKANNAFKKRDYPQAVSVLWELGVDEFFLYSTKVGKTKSKKDNWFKSNAFIEYFFTEFIFQDSKLANILDSNFPEELMSFYYLKIKKPIIKFESVLLKDYPQFYIKLLRTNQVFLRDKYTDFLDSIESKEPFSFHKKIWKYIRTTDQRIWNTIKEQFESIKDQNISEIYSNTILWLDKEYKKDYSINKVHYLAETYSFFIELLFSKLGNDNKAALIKHKKIFEKTKKNPSLEIFNLLDSIYEYINFEEQIISPYCYDLSIDIVEYADVLYLKSTPEAFYNWKVDGVRYDINKAMYFFNANENIKKATVSFLKDAEVSKIKINDKKISVEKIVETLNSLKNSKADYFFKEIQSSKIHNNLPKQIIDNYSYEKNHKFDRFNRKYDVWKMPFTKVDNYVFAPDIFLKENDFFYSLAQYNDKLEETIAIEKQLAKRFENKGWQVLHTGDNSEDIDGDVDVIVSDETATIFIQVKRSNLRLNLKDAYLEHIKSHKKGVDQLNKAEKSISKKKNFFTLKTKPVKWVVSSSFESIGSVIAECRKVNYFEIINSLANSEIITVSDLVRYIEGDFLLKEFSENEYASSELIEEIENDRYIQPLLYFNIKDSISKNKLYNEALELDKDYKTKPDAVKAFNKCIELDPIDVNNYGAIANTYADLKQFDLSFKNFNKALDLVPNEPFISKNYAGALLEAGEYNKGLDLLIKTANKYPFYGNIRKKLQDSYKYCLYKRAFSTQQFIEKLEEINDLTLFKI